MSYGAEPCLDLYESICKILEELLIHKNQFIFFVSTILMLLLTLCSCNKSITGYKSYDDVNIDIINISTRTYGDQNGHRATIEFTVENIGDKTIEYWLIEFSLHFIDSPTITLNKKYRIILNPGDLSKELNATTDIPQFKYPTYATISKFKIID